MRIAVLFFFLCSILLCAEDTLLNLTPAESQEILGTFEGAALIKRAEKMAAKPAEVKDFKKGKIKTAWRATLYGVPLISRMNTLGSAWRLTGKKEFARAGIDTLLLFCRNFPAAKDDIVRSEYGARSHIMYGLSLGAWYFENAMTPEEKNEIAKYGAEYIDLLLKAAEDRTKNYYAIHNWNGLVQGPCAMFAAIMKEYPGNDNRLAESLRILKRWIDLSVDEKGNFLEGVHYLNYGFEHVLLAAWIIRDRGGEDLFALPKIRKIPGMIVQKLIPGTMLMDCRNDAGYQKPGYTMLMIAAATKDPLAAWLWKNGKQDGNFPISTFFVRHLPKAEIDFSKHPLGIFFPQRQFSLWRTGWSKNDVLFSIECGPFTYSPTGKSNTHRQADKGHFCFYAFGDLWAIDGGYANDHWWNKVDSRGLGFAHSLVSIDGVSEVPGVDPKKGNTFSRGYCNNDRFGFVSADMTAAYNGVFGKIRGAQVQSAVRQAFFARPSDGIPAYAVLFDRIVKDEKPHCFAWNMLFPTDKAVTFRPDGAKFSAQNDQPYFKTPKYNTGSAIARFKLDKPGSYRLWGEFAAMNLQYPTRSDSFYVKIDGGEKIQWNFVGDNTFSFYRLIVPEKSMVIVNRLSSRALELSAGEHTIELLGREPDAAVRRLVLDPISRDAGKDKFMKDDRIELKLENHGFTELPASSEKQNSCIVKVFAENMDLTAGKKYYMPPNQMPPALLGIFSVSGTGVNPRFVSVLLPMRGDDKEPEIKCEYGKESVTLTVKWAKITDRIVFRQDGSTPDFQRRAGSSFFGSPLNIFR